MGPLKITETGSPLLWRGAGGEVDASWNERLAAGLLIAGIIAIGILPFWLTDLINPGTEIIIQKVLGVVK